MAKKLGKALIFTAVAGAIAAGGIALYNKYKANVDDFDDSFPNIDDEDDIDDDEDILEESTDSADNAEDTTTSSKREYVPIPNETKEESEKESDYKVNVDVTIDTSNFKEDDETADSTEV